MAYRFIALLAGILLAASQAFSQSATPKVLAELFSNTDCINCPTADEPFKTFVSSNPQYGILLISYHNQIPNISDTFYQASQAWVSYRSNTFYNVPADPYAAINGTTAGAGEGTWVALSKATPITAPNIEVSAKNNGDGTYNIHVVNKATPGKPVRLYVAMTESHIVMDNSQQAYHNPPSGYWDDIFRQMLPGSQGTDAFTPTGNDAYDFTFTPPTPDDPDLSGHFWNVQNMKAVAWIQDDQANPAKKVEALGVFNFGSLGVSEGPTASSTSLRVIGDPSRSDLRVTLPSESHAVIAISDLLGRSTGTLFNGTLPQGETTVQLSSTMLPAGCYVVRMSVNGQPDAVTKLIVQ